MNQPNRIIIPANYLMEIIIKFDPVNGQTELQVRNRSKVQVDMLKVVGLLQEHAATLLRSIIENKLQVAPVKEPAAPNGGENAT